MKKKILAKILAGSLTLAMAFSVLPATAFAEGEDNSSNASTVTETGGHYGTATLTWSQLYGNNNFDVITSATQEKGSAKFDYTLNSDGGTTYKAVAGIPVMVTDEVYEAYEASKNNTEGSESTASEEETGNETEPMISDEVLALAAAVDYDAADATAPSWYVTLGENGYDGITSENFASHNFEAKRDGAITNAVVNAPSTWGDYCVELTEDQNQTHYLKAGKRDSEGYEIGNETLLGGTFTATKNGVEKVYTLGWWENLWSATYEFSFRVAADSEMRGMSNSTNWGQFKDIAGSTITKLTYYTTNGIYEFDLSSFNLYLKNKFSGTVTGDKEAQIADDGSLSVKIDSSSLPSDYKIAIEEVGVSGNRGSISAADKGTYSYENGVLKITAAGVTSAGGAGNWQVKFVDSGNNYVDVSYAFTVKAQEVKTPATTPSTTTPSATTPSTTTPSKTTTSTTATVKKNKTYTVGNYKYKVTKVATSKAAGTVTVTGGKNKKLTSISIPKTVKLADKKSYKVTKVAASAFKSYTKATKITVGANVTTIGANAFYGCTKATTITIGKNVSSIGKKAFYNCKKAKTVTISSKKLTSKKVGASALKKLGASNYKKVTVKVPSSKLKAYKKFLTKKGLSSKAKIKK